MLGIITTAISAAISSVQAFVATVGPKVVATATKFLEVAKEYLPKVVNFIQTMAQSMQILPNNETIEDIGRKAKLSDKKPEDFDTTKDYIDYIRNTKIDPEKVKTETDVDKYTNQALGASLMIKSISETKGADIPVETWVTMAKLGLEQPEANALLDNFKQAYDQLNDYINGRQSPEQEIATGDKLVAIYKEIYPDLTDEQIEAKVMQLELDGASK